MPFMIVRHNEATFYLSLVCPSEAPCKAPAVLLDVEEVVEETEEEEVVVVWSRCVSRCKQDDAELFSRQLNTLYV